MKIEHVQAIKNIPQKPQPAAHFKHGDLFVSEVLEVNGKTALLRSEQGTLLTARLLGDISLMAGDHVETVVDETGTGRYVLRLVDLSRHDAKAAPGDAGKAPDSAAAQSLKAQTLHNTLAMLKKNAGLEPKTAVFLARNGIAGTPENIDTLGRLVKGEQKTAALLMQIRDEAASARPAAAPPAQTPAGAAERIPITATATEAKPDPSAATASPDATAAAAVSKAAARPATHAASAAQTEPAKAAGAPVAPSASAQTAPSPDAKMAAEQAAKPHHAPDGHTAHPTADTVDKSGHAAAGKTATGGPRPAAVQTDAGIAGQSATPAETEKPVQSLSPAQQLLSMFVNLKDKENLAAQLKKAVKELPEQIKELKLLINAVDINDRDAAAQKAQHLEKQITLLSEVKHFDCYHIPLTGGSSEQETAELYVYRQRHRKDEAQAENFVILLGLDTQHMGRVETVIRSGGSRVSLEFRLEKPELGDAFVHGARQLEPVISQTGYHLADVSARELEAKTTVLTAEQVLSLGQEAASGSLDVRI